MCQLLTTVCTVLQTQNCVSMQYWGSSILSGNYDTKRTVKKAADDSNTKIAANVTGINLSTLIQNTMAPFQSANTESAGGNLILKMDVEGAEYGLIEEVYKSGILCDYVSKYKNNAILWIEYHYPPVIDTIEYNKISVGINETIQGLKDCGVIFAELGANWDGSFSWPEDQ